MSSSRKITPLKQNSKKTVRMSNTQKFLLLLMIIIALVTTLPILVVLLIGLLPTFTLMVVDIKNINKLIIVGCFNLAGVFVYMFNLLKNFSLDSALFIFNDIFNMILMLGSAGIGLVVYYEIPKLFIYIAKASNQKHIANIDSRIEKMQETWGSDIIRG